MPVSLVVGFIAGSIVELIGLLWVASWFSTMNTFSWLMLSFLIGVVVGRSYGNEHFEKIQWHLKSQTQPSDELINAVVMASASLLLITPGCITDLLGLLILIPGTRPMIKEMLVELVNKRIRAGAMYFFIKE